MKKVVLLDVGSTLISPKPSVGKVYADAARKFGMDFDGDKIQPVFSKMLSDKELEYPLTSSEIEREWWQNLVHELLASFTEIKSFDSFFAEMWDYFTLPEAWFIYDDVFPTLEKFKADGIRLAVVSNWDSRLKRLCDDLGLTTYFDYIAISAFEGSAKPSPQIFMNTLEKLGADADSAIHIGDSIRMDINGARNAGIDALLIDREGKREVSERLRVIQSLDEILSVLNEFK